MLVSFDIRLETKLTYQNTPRTQSARFAAASCSTTASNVSWKAESEADIRRVLCKVRTVPIM
jgi:hypothetical protein